MPTVFMAQWGAGKPVIAFLGEYDALDGMSQQAGTDCYQPLSEISSGHGCGHNLLGTAGVAAAAAVKEYLSLSKKTGTIRYYGCPAEKGGAEKTFMVREGCFDDVDIALTWHPSSQNMMFTTGTLANIQADFHFHGISSHASASPHIGRSALDALELMNVGVNFLREHIIPEARIHYAITDTGGTAPNIVQPEAAATYLVCAPSVTETNNIFQRVIRIAKGAAMMTDTQMSMKLHTAVSNYIPNMALTDILEQNLRTLLPMQLLIVGFIVASIIVLLQSQLADFMLPSSIDLTNWLPSGCMFGIAISPLLIGVGYIMGMKSSVGYFFGNIITGLIVSPLLLRSGAVETVTWESSATRIVSPASGFLIGGTVLTMLLNYKSFLNSFKALTNAKISTSPNADMRDRDLPLWLPLSVIGAGTVLLAIIFNKYALFITFPLVVVLAFLFSLVAARTTSETDLCPTSLFVWVTMAIVGTVITKNPGVIAFTSGIVAVSVGQASDSMNDMKTGQMIGAVPGS